MNHNPSVSVVRKIEMYYFIREIMKLDRCWDRTHICHGIILLLLTMRLIYHKRFRYSSLSSLGQVKPSFIRNVCTDRMVFWIISKHNCSTDFITASSMHTVYDISLGFYADYFQPYDPPPPLLSFSSSSHWTV